MQSIGNTFYYVLLVVPLQTALALGLALVVNNKLLKGQSFFRTAFYFPSVTSSIAISTVFLFLFSNTGAVNALLHLVGHRRAAVVQRLAGACCTSSSAGSAPATTPRWGQVDILGRSPVGLALGARRSRCASSSSSPSGPRRAPSC